MENIFALNLSFLNLKEIKKMRDCHKRLFNLKTAIYIFSHYVVSFSEIKGILQINLKVETLNN